MIRKSGWLVMLVVLGLVLAFVYLFAGFAIRHSLIYALEESVGAEVNIDDVGVSLAPLALDIKHLQITNKNSPDDNVLSFAQARASVAVWPALMGYYVINEVTVDGFELGSARARPGKVYRGDNANAEKTFDLTDTLKLDLPQADELISRANLQTGEKGKALSEQASRQQENLKSLEKQLPNKARVNELEQQIKALTDSKIESAADLAKKADELKAVKDALNTEYKKLLSVKDGLGESRHALELAVSDLRNASVEDWQKLQNLTNLNGGGLASLSQILLGDYWGKKIAQLQSLYLMAKPYLPEDSKIQEDEVPVLPNRILPLSQKPYPSFWIKEARVNWLVAGGTATFSMKDITQEHAVINAPTLLDLKVAQMPRLNAFNLHGEFSIMKKMTSDVQWTLTGYEMQSHQFNFAATTLELTDAKINSTGSFKLINRDLVQNAEISLQKPVFAPSENSYLKPLIDALNQQPKIPLTVGAKGDVGDPEVTVRSPLDRILGDALLGEAKKKVAVYEKDLKAKLEAKLQQQLKGKDQWLGELDTQDSAVESMEKRIQELLAANLTDLKGSTEKRFKDGLKDRLK